MARAFEPEEFKKYFEHVDIEETYQMVRTAWAIACFFGANWVAELERIKYGGKIIAKRLKIMIIS